jgi:mannose-1-phosphate guanylyltransferase
MRAMILAAGLGTRLRPLTQVCPKPLLPLMLQPMLGHLLEQLRRQGVREVAINLHHRAAQLREWIEGRQGDMRLYLSHEPEILGTAGGMKAMQAFLRQAPFLVINADVLANVDVRALWQWHCERQALVTMVVRPDPAARKYGPVRIDTADRVLQINGRPPTRTPVPGQETVFTGIQMVSPEVLDRIPSGRFSSTTTDVYPALVAETRAVYGYRHKGYWMDVGVPRRYLQAHWDLLNGVLGDEWLDRLPPGSVAMLKQRMVGPCQPSASLIPPVVLGARVEVSAGACIGPYAVLGAGCRVEAGAAIRNSVLWEDVHVAAAATIDQSILGTGVRVPRASVWHDVIRIP